MAEKQTSMSSRQQEEIFGILLITLGMLILVSLISYFIYPEEAPQGALLQRVENAMGIAGVYIANVLVKYLLGYPAIIIPLLLIAWGWNRFRGHATQRLQRASIYGLLAALYFATLFAMPHAMNPKESKIGYSWSGLVGGFIAEHLHRAFGDYGSPMILLALAVVIFIAFSQISLAEAYEKVRTGLKNIRKWLEHTLSSIQSWRPKFPVREPKAKVKTLTTSAVAESRTTEVVPDEEEVEEVPEPRWKRLARLREMSEKPASPSTVIPGKPQPLETAAPPEAISPVRPAPPEAPAPTPPKKVKTEAPATGEYVFPPLDLLDLPKKQDSRQSREELLNNAHMLEERLAEFDVQGNVVEINPGPVITRYEYEPAPGIKVSRITALADDLALAMRAKRIRIVAPIPGKAAVGIELPNPEPQTVYLRKLIDSDAFRQSASPLTIALGETISGQVYVTSLDRMPHLLVAGATGSGKSVCLNAIIASILYKAHPSQVEFVLVDPKRLELSAYRKLRFHHLTFREDLNEEVVTSAQNALAVLRSLEWEMENRYSLLAHVGVRNITEYNTRLREGKLPALEDAPLKPLSYMILVIDELADLMLLAAKEVEEPIARLTQMSRAVGIHLIVATQRPSVDVITGVIKANFPARIAFQVASKIDSRTILDMNGAEKLLGNGDMLFLPPGSPEPIRIHGAYISSEETERIIEHIRKQPRYEKDLLPIRTEGEEEGMGPAMDGQRDELFDEALKLVVRHQQGSISLLQRRLKIGYSRAARLIDQLEAAGVVGGFDGSKAREVLIDESQLEEMGLGS
ncbi:MAG: DNA translocase FtsK [candidate division KSB1 bacterium]|nr:DNA translocase FtsK [candidate division KSB1 bacterium]MDZ7304611.1 DNA translocase FtsK [candidate division KSB1 bacterium]MDZ7313744.1 DNA translocase FtsK [candidate division KSB1 bacterium]